MGRTNVPRKVSGSGPPINEVCHGKWSSSTRNRQESGRAPDGSTHRVGRERPTTQSQTKTNTTETKLSRMSTPV